MFKGAGERIELAGCLRRLAGLAALYHQDVRAITLLASADALEEITGYVPLPATNSWRERNVAELRARVSADTFMDAWSAGRPMTPDEAIDLAAGMDLPSGDDPIESGAEYAAFGLSPRELDVVRLLVDGRSNSEIADALFVSPRTVTTHMTHIFSKLGVNSRTAVVSTILKERPD
jgi:non-specific serine/threonine protein kinase